MTGRPLLVLVGPPGAGKSAVGALLADRLGVGFRDTDRDIEVQAGGSVPAIFIDQGEAGFRVLEQAAVARALAEHAGVLALGSGAVLSADTRELLRGQRVVALSVDSGTAAVRTGLSRDRPVLALNPRARLRALLQERRPFYEQVSLATVATDDLTPEQAAEAVLAVLALP